MGNADTATPAGDPSLLQIEQRGAVLTIGLNRPAKRNALNDGIILAIGDCFAGLPDDVRVVVIHGLGDNFSSGLDLSELRERDATEGLVHSQMWHRVFDRIQYCRVPVIAALKGAVIGGGGSVRLPRLIGVARMMDMMLTGRVYSATEGSSYGFAQYLVEAGASMTKAMELAGKIASNAPLTNFAVLQALPMIAEANPQTGLLMESLMATVAQSDQEAKRRIRAFLDHKTAKVKPT
ncbi:MAG: crotonase/enoyl-CoA hydratase family protein [Bradyrhizobium sp.]|nr:crotonase/enoyl-CoA hydratase family protein [Bradyrhizobium sp.]